MFTIKIQFEYINIYIYETALKVLPYYETETDIKIIYS